MKLKNVLFFLILFAVGTVIHAAKVSTANAMVVSKATTVAGVNPFETQIVFGQQMTTVNVMKPALPVPEKWDGANTNQLGINDPNNCGGVVTNKDFVGFANYSAGKKQCGSSKMESTNNKNHSIQPSQNKPGGLVYLKHPIVATSSFYSTV